MSHLNVENVLFQEVVVKCVQTLLVGTKPFIGVDKQTVVKIVQADVMAIAVLVDVKTGVQTVVLSKAALV